MKKFSKRLLILMCSFPMVMVFLTGCGDTESENVKTKGIHADIEVVDTGDNDTTIRAELSVGSGGGTTKLDLTGGDHLVAKAGEHSQQLSQIDGIIGIYYITTLPRLDPDTVVNVAFYRDDDPDAVDSNVTMPQPFTLTQPADGHVVTDVGEAIAFSWSPHETNDSMRLVTTYDCQSTSDKGTVVTTTGHGQTFVIGDQTGSASYRVVDLLGEEHYTQKYDLGCSRITVTLKRERFGTVDPNYESGNISASQNRTVNLKYVP